MDGGVVAWIHRIPDDMAPTFRDTFSRVICFKDRTAVINDSMI